MVSRSTYQKVDISALGMVGFSVMGGNGLDGSWRPFLSHIISNDRN